MTFNIFVKSRIGQPVFMAAVLAIGEVSGRTFSRGTDGNGYSNVDMKDTPVGELCTLMVIAPGYKNGIEYPTVTTQDQTITVILDSFNHPSIIAPRFWKGNMCGVRIPNLSYTAEGAHDPSIVLSWFYDRYNTESQSRIKRDWKDKDLTHHNLSWPDSRAVGQTEDDFIETNLDLIDNKFYPCPFLFSKDFDRGKDVPTLLAETSIIRSKLRQIGVPLLCIAWEASLWLTPEDHQELIDAITPEFVSIGTRCYCHFQEGYPSYQPDGKFVSDFWKANVGKLTGILYQKEIAQTDAEFRDSISDCLQRFSGGWGMPDDSGFGHPFDFVCFELSATRQFNEAYTEQEGNRLGTFAINSPHCFGPTGVEAFVMGSGNGHE